MIYPEKKDIGRAVSFRAYHKEADGAVKGRSVTGKILAFDRMLVGISVSGEAAARFINRVDLEWAA